MPTTRPEVGAPMWRVFPANGKRAEYRVEAVTKVRVRVRDECGNGASLAWEESDDRTDGEGGFFNSELESLKASNELLAKVVKEGVAAAKEIEKNKAKIATLGKSRKTTKVR